jgi:hypothetical protein
MELEFKFICQESGTEGQKVIKPTTSCLETLGGRNYLSRWAVGVLRGGRHVEVQIPSRCNPVEVQSRRGTIVLRWEVHLDGTPGAAYQRSTNKCLAFPFSKNASLETDEIFRRWLTIILEKNYNKIINHDSE